MDETSTLQAIIIGITSPTCRHCTLSNSVTHTSYLRDSDSYPIPPQIRAARIAVVKESSEINQIPAKCINVRAAASSVDLPFSYPDTVSVL